MACGYRSSFSPSPSLSRARSSGNVSSVNCGSQPCRRRCPSLGSNKHIRSRCNRVIAACTTTDAAAGGSVTDLGTSSSSSSFLREMSTFLEEDLKHLFDQKGIDRKIYADNVKFEDPITRYDSIDGYLFNIQMLRYLFTPEFILHSIKEVSPTTLETRWTMNMKLRVLPWQPDLIFTGTSQYEFDLESKKVIRHSDTWDSIQNQEYFSVEGLRDLVKQASNLAQTPELESPKYTTMKRTAEYEIREYDPFIVCETATSSSEVTTGEGFNTLAAFIFGKNSREEKMNMTTPVYTTSSTSDQKTKMQFVIEKSKYEKTSDVPSASASGTADAGTVVRVKDTGGAVCAAISVPGVPLEKEVRDAEANLRTALERDGFQVEDGYELARYNEPFVLPPFRRNEVLIKIRDFSL